MGFRTVDLLAQRYGRQLKKPFLKSYCLTQVDLQAGRLYLVKPLTFMNRSGDIFPEILMRTGAGMQSMLVVCDTMDLPVGQCRFKRGGSSPGHNGLSDIIRRLGREDFPRLYIGIGRPSRRSDVVRYVLCEPKGREADALEEAVHTAADGVVQIMEDGLTEFPQSV